MTTFARNEIVSSTQFVRNFSAFMTNLRNHDVEKVGIVRNNEMEAVMISIHEYETLKSKAEKSDRKSIKDYFGSMSDETFEMMQNALKDCRKVNPDEW